MSTVSGTTENPFDAFGLAYQPKERSTALGQADFLLLMTEQLKNQDPLKPLDNNQFLGQLAQFSTVQGIDKMQSAMDSVASVMESDQALRAASLVGHDALIEASELEVSAGQTVKGEINAPSAGPVTVEIVDSAGVRVRQMTIQAGAAGAQNWEWDGLNDAGEPVAGGTYGIRATAGSGKEAQALEVCVATRIDSVSIEPTGLVLNLSGLGSYPLSAIRRIG